MRAYAVFLVSETSGSRFRLSVFLCSYSLLKSCVLQFLNSDIVSMV